MLSQRQRQCLRGVLDLKTAKEIGREIGLSHHMVEMHLMRARNALGARDSREAARIFASLEDGVDPHRAKPYTVEPYYGSSELSLPPEQELDLARRIPKRDSSNLALRDSAGESKGIVYGFNALETLGAILLASVALVLILALLIAVAQGFAILNS